MKKTSVLRQAPLFTIILIVALFAGAFAAFRLLPQSGNYAPPDEAAQAAARDLLTSTVREKRYDYAGFLAARGDARTPASAPIRARPEVAEGAQGAQGGDVPQAALSHGDAAVYRFAVPAEGLYRLRVETRIPGRSFSDITLSALVNGEVPYREAANIRIPLFWRDTTKDFPLDAYGDETVPSQETWEGRRRVDLYDRTAVSSEPLLFFFDAGENQVELVNTSSRLIELGELEVLGRTEPLPYAEYAAKNAQHTAVDTAVDTAVSTVLVIDAISYDRKNSPAIQLRSEMDAGLSPFDPVNKKINILSMEKAGSEVFFRVQVEEAGIYHLALHCKTQAEGFAVFCSLKLDGEPPFAEAASFPLKPSRDQKWRNQVWAEENGAPYGFFLTSGEHTLSLKLELEPVAAQIRDLQLLIDHINQFSLDVKKITGKEVDKNRTWRLTQILPETAGFLNAYDVIFRSLLFSLAPYSSGDTKAPALAGIVEVLSLLDKLREKPDELPLKVENLSGDAVSALKLAGDVMDSLYNQRFSLDAVYLYGEGSHSGLPRENAPFFKSAGAALARLWASYASPKYAARKREHSLNIWVNQSVVHVDALQKLIDTHFSPETGIDARLSIMPDVNKLVLAKAAGTNPDLALSLPSHLPFDLASRGAASDLTRFDDFWTVARRFVPGALVSYLFNEGVYALPETVDFAVTAYREDIFKRLDLPLPHTWDDVRDMMPELQRFNMSFYLPIASGEGYKWFYQTAPLIYQNGGELYQPDGLGAAINEAGAVKGIAELGELFTTYALAEQVPVFFNAFRFGQTPAGIMDSAAYILLKNGAPELAGQWGILPYPGTRRADGSLSRWFIANGRGALLFENSPMADEGWEFLKWWLSEPVQSEYAFTLAANYNLLWLPANLAALENAPMEDRDLAVVMESVANLRDVPRSPGQYLLERSLSDIWNAMVFDGTPAQAAIDMKLVDIQREFRRKMTEAGYIDARGRQRKPYTVRELDWVLEKIKEAGI
ncbi:MAG: extracellular solute-binding protein [Treponema sp.]|jgi:ABC-type glycerol-3-phosphate transport system substrate-binding protein|nr:extracellular solute-binding protein [Treponema sp.]